MVEVFNHEVNIENHLAEYKKILQVDTFEQGCQPMLGFSMLQLLYNNWACKLVKLRLNKTTYLEFLSGRAW